MIQQHILDRAYGYISHNAVKRDVVTRLTYALQSSSVSFGHKLPLPNDPIENLRAHIAGVNALTIDKFEGRYLLSGGADSSIAIWDLEAQPTVSHGWETFQPLLATHRTADEHKLGITQIAFYPFDSLAFLTSSYDHTVKLYSSETLAPSASFDLNSVVYNIALSPIASHLLVACASQHPAVRLVDLRSGASTHALSGHSGAVLSTAWSPVTEHILASGAADGSVRFWDIRSSVAELGVLDLEDSTGLLAGTQPADRNAAYCKAHKGPVNGIQWTEDGRHLITCGHDDRIRVWNTETRANTLANFGPMVRNSGLAPCIPILAPAQDLQSLSDVMYHPNGHEILAYELWDGKLYSRLRRPEQQQRPHEITAKNKPKVKDRISALSWRAHNTELYSAHADGSIAVWRPRTDEDADLDQAEEQEEKDRNQRTKRKRDVLDDIYTQLTKKPITFGGL